MAHLDILMLTLRTLCRNIKHNLSLCLREREGGGLMHAKLIVFVFMVLQLVAMRFGGTMRNMALAFCG